MTRITPRSGLLAIPWRELWSYRELAWLLAVRDLKVRYKQAYFGVAWAVLQPVLSVALFTFIFQRVAGLSSDGVPYPVFALVGLAIWTFFSTAVNDASRILVDSPHLVTKVYFPRLLAPVAAQIPPLVELAVMAVVLAVAMVVYGVVPGVTALTAPLWLLPVLCASLGTGMILSALNVQYRDVGRVLQFLLQLWFFATPVVFSSGLFHGTARTVLALNPLTEPITGLRWALTGSPAPAVAHVALCLAVSVGLLVGGTVYFRVTERRFADVI